METLSPLAEDKARLNLLRNELKLAGVDLARQLYPPWAKSARLRQSILNELLVALETPVHEGLIPPYGSILVPEDASLEPLVELNDGLIPLARSSADGSSALVAFRMAGFVGLKLLEPSGAPELDLVRLVNATGGIAFKRDRNGIVRIYNEQGTLRRDEAEAPKAVDPARLAKGSGGVAPTVDAYQSYVELAFRYKTSV